MRSTEPERKPKTINIEFTPDPKKILKTAGIGITLAGAAFAVGKGIEGIRNLLNPPPVIGLSSLQARMDVASEAADLLIINGQAVTFRPEGGEGSAPSSAIQSKILDAAREISNQSYTVALSEIYRIQSPGNMIGAMSTSIDQPGSQEEKDEIANHCRKYGWRFNGFGSMDNSWQLTPPDDSQYKIFNINITNKDGESILVAVRMDNKSLLSKLDNASKSIELGHSVQGDITGHVDTFAKINAENASRFDGFKYFDSHSPTSPNTATTPVFVVRDANLTEEITTHHTNTETKSIE